VEGLAGGLGQTGLGPAKTAQPVDGVPRHEAGRTDPLHQEFETGRSAHVHALFLDGPLEIVQDDRSGSGRDSKSSPATSIMRRSRVSSVEAVGERTLVGQELFDGYVAVDAEVAPAHLEALLQIGAVAHESLPSISGESGVWRKRSSFAVNRL